MIPLSKPFLGGAEYKAALDVLKSGWLIHGAKNDQFEKNFAKYIGVKYAVSLNSCASALQLAVEASNIKGEVIVPSFTHMASANAIIRAGATPVFADIDQKTCTLDPKSIESVVTKRTKAVMVVHFAGQSADMDAIMRICKREKLILIEDSAENIGGRWKNKVVGSFGIGCFSFFPGKNMTTTEGGMLTTNNPEVAKKVRIIAGHGVASSFLSREKLKKFWIREAVLPGFNFRMSNVQAAIGVEQLKKLDRMNTIRRKRAHLLSKLLQSHHNILLPFEDPRAFHVYQMYTVQVPITIRDSLVFELRRKGIGASVHFDPPVHLQPYYKKKKFLKGNLAVTEKISKSIITLPLYPLISEKDIQLVARTFLEAMGTVKKK